MATWRLKACPRCGGDVIVDREESQCLQCGFDRLEPPAFALAVQARIREEPMSDTDGRGRWDRGRVGRPALAQNGDRNHHIREMAQEHVPLKEIGCRYGLTISAVSLIARGLR
ncbi:hypothetical protein LCGC14_0824920 [marine sediment metagenome]|uniref:Uncharacterized protein n=1 Tax=marine sediment metagenome TaxID=412755 RepID=A0A0F9Q2Y7_9ZZZZ